MKYYTDTYSGIDNIFNDIFKKNYKNIKTNIVNDSNFAYIQKFNNININDIKNIKYFNNFLDPNNKLCQTGNYCLGNKIKFYKYFLNYYSKIPEYIPNTISFSKKNHKQIKNLFNDNIWIIKPANSFARKGITILKKYDSLLEWINKFPKFNDWIIQKYVDNPLLFNKKKFHIRFYCLAIKDKDIFKAYMYKDGFFYLSNLPYDKNDLNLDRHLTGAKYCFVHQIYPDLKNYISESNFTKIIDQAKKIIIDTMNICKDILTCPNNVIDGKCFHLFAFDLLPDINYKLYLLEVNNGTVGMETIDYRPDLCLTKKSKKLHNIKIIRQLHNDLVDLVINNAKNTNFKKLNLDIIEKFQNNNLNINYKTICNILVYLLFLIIIFKIMKNKL